jgi:hypothetical protein
MIVNLDGGSEHRDFSRSATRAPLSLNKSNMSQSAPSPNLGALTREGAQIPLMLVVVLFQCANVFGSPAPHPGI